MGEERTVKSKPIVRSFPVSKDTWEPLEKRPGIAIISKAKKEPGEK